MSIDKESIKRIVKENESHSCPDHMETCVKIVAIADLPSRFGDFQVVAFHNDLDKKEHAAFVRGNVFGQENVPVRIHSECLTGDAIGSLRCDCRDQLEKSLTMLGKMEFGVLLYLRQEGRGIGLTNKIRAYQLQDDGYDTFEANKALGFKEDERDYAIAAHMLWSLGIKSIRLMSNNPNKLEDLKHHGVKITGRIPVVIPPNEHNSFYLETKKNKGGHMLDKNEEESYIEQDDDLIDFRI
ncbi:MAG: GTP cyclohydrolase II [Thermoplasmatales archaeon]|jgi:GTP cyclohydrolase II|nr:GTP cyclohydrolase II [Candidatus Thermoplasmatota archaeon]MCL6002799.1 GTP cyclohydrolase II [Candidatus Thermoplasmatota archaeon]MDA8056126.1 GTP cyclohydrolase II [Thermoplasmatales archaeon]